MSSAFPSKKLTEVAEINPALRELPNGDEVVSFVPMSAVDAESASTSLGEDRPYSEVSKG